MFTTAHGFTLNKIRASAPYFIWLRDMVLVVIHRRLLPPNLLLNETIVPNEVTADELVDFNRYDGNDEG